MSQISYVLGDIKRSKLKYFRFFIQLLVSLILICFLLSLVIELTTFRQKIQQFSNLSDLYILRDVTDDELISYRLFEMPETEARLFELYAFIHQRSDVVAYSGFNQPIRLQDQRLEKLAAYQTEFGEAYYSRLLADDAFIRAFSLRCQSGSFFNSDELDQSLTQVVLGSSYKTYFKIGDKIDQTRFVSGFLEERSFYLAPGETNTILYLDKVMIEPLRISSESDLASLDMALTKMTILTPNKTSLDLIKTHSEGLSLYDLQFISFSEQLENIKAETLQYALSLLVLVILILFFCIICLVSARPGNHGHPQTDSPHAKNRRHCHTQQAHRRAMSEDHPGRRRPNCKLIRIH